MAASLIGRGRGSPEKIAGLLTDMLLMSAVSCELVDRIDRKIGDESAILLVFEKYYMRSQNRASLSIMLTGSDGEVFADIVGAGGGTGVFLRFSWGAEESFEESACAILESLGFERL